LKPSERIFVALDTVDAARALTLTRDLAGLVGGVKLGKEFFTANGPAGVERITAAGMPVFLDLKFHDIQQTVAAAVAATSPLRPFMLNVHALGGAAMMRAAAEAAAAAGAARPLLVAVTVLTSLDDGDLDDIGLAGPVLDRVLALARLAQGCGLDGVVCSPLEVAALRRELGPDFKLVVPGIRPTWAAAGDQKRVMTPRQALDAGADYLVIGRPITGADDPRAAAERIVDELEP
jgi:orotidine-5'-phosphate decarboxylase